MRDNFLGLAFLIAAVFSAIPISAGAEVLYEQNFDANGDWTQTQSTSQDYTCYTGSTGCSAFIQGMPAGFDTLRIGHSYCANAGHNTAYINPIAGFPSESTSSGCYGGSGKCLTFWDESCTPTGQWEDSDADFGVRLTQEYQELYMAFRVKFGRKQNGAPYEFTGKGDNPADWSVGKKLGHLQYWGGTSTPYNYFCRDLDNLPVHVPGFKSYNGDVSIYWGVRGYADDGVGLCKGEGNFTPQLGDGGYYYLGYVPQYTYRNEVNNSGTQDAAYIAQGSGGFNSALNDGNWHTVVTRYKLNTFNSQLDMYNADGVFEMWLDGVRYASRTNGVWFQGTKPVNRGINLVSWGGNNYAHWIMTGDNADSGREQWYAMDDLVVSTTYIEPGYVIGGGTPPVTAKKHKISVQQTDGGRITPGRKKGVMVKHGGNRNFLVKPGRKYYVADILVDGVSVLSAAEKLGRAWRYRFTTVESDHTITAAFEPL